MTRRCTSMLVLDPRWSSDFTKLAQDLAAFGFRPFETYRTDSAQLSVFNLGTSKARPGESAHQWGLAVDFVPYDDAKGWHWPKADDPIWTKIDECLRAHTQLTHPLEWDKPHVQVVNWRAWRSEDHRQWLRQWERRNMND